MLSYVTDPATEAMLQRCATLSNSLISALEGARTSEGLIALMATLSASLRHIDRDFPSVKTPPEIVTMLELLSLMMGRMMRVEIIKNSEKG
jgi:hypothetical protein